jgi:glycosyltransferase involved in cell wall biosynthesis
MRISLVTDAWLPQINGVTTTLSQCCTEIERLGHEIDVISPTLFRTTPCPGYPEIRLAWWPTKAARLLEEQRPDAIHIATEGPIGFTARRYCARHGLPFTTAFHTKFPDYLRTYAKIPTSLTYRFLRWFHGSAHRTLVPTPTMKRELEDRGFSNLVEWVRGVDTELFRPRADDFFGLPRPIFISVGRVAPEKNLRSFLELDLAGSKVVVGDGPARAQLETEFPAVHWAGMRLGEDLARHYAGADVFVFPSRTDTYGVVMLEANASGLPVAAYPVTGPIDVVVDGVTGVLDDDLEKACRGALKIDRDGCRHHAESMSWSRCAELMLDTFAVIDRL